jgi:chorismate mutase
MTEMLQEFCDSRNVRMRVDRQAGIIRGVKILGLQSRNGRQYVPEALSKAVPLYEGAKVNVNHPKGSPLAPRDYQDRIGVIRGAVLKPNEGLFGDLHFNPKHVLAEQLAWDAEHAPENVGFSHNVQARTSRRDDSLLVEEIVRVQSVDLVADPATTRGLYEQAQQDPAQQSKNVPPYSLVQATLEQLKAERPDLIESLLLEQRAELEQLRAERDAAVLEQQIAAELATAGLDAALVTELFRQQLRSTSDAATRRQLILERVQFAKAVGAARPSSKDQHSVEAQSLPWTTGDVKGFAQRITSV